MQAALDLVLPYVRERRQFGKPIGSFELMQGKLADMYVALESSRAFAYRVAEGVRPRPARRAGRPRRPRACCTPRSARWRWRSRRSRRFGGMGYVNENAAGRLLRDAKLYTIGAGTNEIRRMLIGRGS